MAFSEDERLFLQTICRYFHERAQWPTYDYLDRTLTEDHEDFDVEVVGQKLEQFMYDGWYLPMRGWDPQRQATLSISAIYTCYSEGVCPELGEDMEAFMQVIHLCIEKFRTRGDGLLHVTAAEVRDRFAMSDLVLRKVFDLASRAGLTHGSSYSEPLPGEQVQWTFSVSPDLRKYRRVKTVAEFIGVRENLLAAQRKMYQAGAYLTALPSHMAVQELPDVSLVTSLPNASNTSAALQLHPIEIFPTGPFARNEHLCFVLMPFAEEMRPVYDQAILHAATQAGLECVRADEISKPGGIMAQVWQKLMESRVVVADLTHMNANVFYELGLAHAIGHHVILLTQDIESVPFDLRHMRCIVYQPDAHGLRLLAQNVRQALKDVLAEPAP